MTNLGMSALMFSVSGMISFIALFYLFGVSICRLM